MRIHRKSTATYENISAEIDTSANTLYVAEMTDSHVPSSWYARKAAICHSLGKYTDAISIWALQDEIKMKWAAARDAIEAWKIDNLRN